MKYMLVHGSWHGAWCWQKLGTLLEQRGHDVNCLELPGSGRDFLNATNIFYDDLYHYVFSAIASLEQPAVVLAHSSAGLIVTQVCEQLHQKIQFAYYIAAWLPREGCSLVDMAVAYNNSDLPSVFIKSDNENLLAIDPEKAKDFFYHDCSENDRDWASAQLRAKSARPDREKMPPFSPSNTLSKSAYILCQNDRVVNPISQLDMAQRFGFSPDQIHRVPAGHSPFLSMPDVLLDIIS